MNNTAVDPIFRAAAVAAALAVSACATAKPALPPAPAKSAHAAPLAAAPSAAAQDPAPAPAAMPAGTLTRVGGIVVSEDAAARSLTIKEYGGGTRTFRLADGARITKGGDDASIGLDGVAAGDRVRLKVGGDVIASAHVLVRPAQ